VAIGNFDGVHRGHRAVLRTATERARAAELEPVVLTFDPHPAEVLGRGKRPALTPVARKVELLRRTSTELTVVVEPFTIELSQLSPRAFAEAFLVGELGAKVIIVGQNFRFGHGRAGDLSTLSSLGRELGFEALALPIDGDAGGSFSSSRARAALARGDLDEFHRVVGRPHAISGRVSVGDGRGRTLGFPTANLVDVVEALPPDGVYACVVDRLGDDGTGRCLAAGVLNIGQRPTHGAGFSVEVHLFDWDADLYGARLRLHFIEYLRPEARFSGVDALVQQIERDVAQARERTQGVKPAADAGGSWF
jgi:riboflavin kinase / FMN adenylyltransferase